MRAILDTKITKRQTHENARRQPGVDTSNKFSTKHNAPRRTAQLFAGRLESWLCQKLCGDKFFNIDASREIDRLTLELEKLRAGGIR